LITRIAALESRLIEQQGEIVTGDHFLNLMEGSTFNGAPNEDQQRMQQYRTPTSDTETNSNNHFTDERPYELQPISPGTCVSELMRADLDQSYFDRVHIFAPFLHRRRYFSWAREPVKSDSRTCLQFAMWTMAASLSAQFQHLSHSLYRDIRQLLEALDSKDNRMEHIDIHQAQAWILLAIYEFMRMNYRRGWLSAGRSFRLVQLMRLYEIDSPSNSLAEQTKVPSPGDWVEIEEKRRTFWMAYTLDRLVSMHNEWPLTLNEQVISTRLPAPELEFQSGRPVLTGFLSEAIASSDHAILSSFVECINLATICGRGISHRQRSTVERVYGDVSQDFWDRHQWLDDILTQRMQILSLHYPSASEQVDPMLLFTNMVAQTTVIYLYKTIESMSWETDEYQISVLSYEKRAMCAAREIVVLAKALSQLSYFKVHPFTPIPLFICAEFLLTHRDLDVSIDIQLEEILEALRDLKNVNNLANDYLNLFEPEGDRGHFGHIENRL
jgi:hypothetical protein